MKSCQKRKKLKGLNRQSPITHFLPHPGVGNSTQPPDHPRQWAGDLLGCRHTLLAAPLMPLLPLLAACHRRLLAPTSSMTYHTARASCTSMQRATAPMAHEAFSILVCNQVSHFFTGFACNCQSLLASPVTTSTTKPYQVAGRQVCVQREPHKLMSPHAQPDHQTNEMLCARGKPIQASVHRLLKTQHAQASSHAPV